MKELLTLYGLFFKIGIMTFGGGYAMLPMLERELVTNRKFVTMEEIMDYFAVGQCTPGIIAVNTATFIGYKRKGVLGGIFATLGVITPSLIIITLLASILSFFAGNEIVKHSFAGISVAVCALIVQAILKLSKSGIKDVFTGIVAGVSFILVVFVKGLSPIVIILAAAAAGVVFKAICEKKQKEDK